jgi:hypothetical protein
MTARNNRKMVIVELNEAERHFLDKYATTERLPTFKKFLTRGKIVETRIASWNSSAERAWRHITPWIIWPSVYTGMKPEEHRIIAFGQDTQILQGRCIWDRLNAKGISTGVCGNLMSYPVRRNLYSLFYIPEALATTADCFPDYYRPIQEFLVFTARNYSENFLPLAMKSAWKLMRGVLRGIPAPIAYELLAQVPLELIKGPAFHRHRALLQGKLQMALFELLYRRYKPQFATVHLNHIAYMQHRYWRAAEPERFKDEMGDLDRYFFGTLSERKRYEYAFKNAILESFQMADDFLARLSADFDDENTLFVVMTGLGQGKMDPLDEIHNPEIRLLNIESLLRTVDVTGCEILTQMNPDITLNFKSEGEASRAATKLRELKVLGEHPLFHIEQVSRQLFLEVTLPSRVWSFGREAWIENETFGQKLPLFKYVRASKAKDQSTAQHCDRGWMLLYGHLASSLSNLDEIDVSEISPILLKWWEEN